MRKVKEKTKIGMPIIICAIIFLMICILNTENKPAVAVCSIAIGMHLMLLFDIVKERKSDSK